MTISAPNRQGLKPFSFQTLYGTVETVPHKDFLVATHALKPVLLFSNQILAAARAHLCGVHCTGGNVATFSQAIGAHLAALR